MKLSFLLVAVSAFAETLTVSPQGPLRNLASARDRVREMRRAGAKTPVTVLIRGGTYFLSEPFVLTAEDSDVTYAAYPKERPILSGGRRIEGWTKGKAQLWTAPTPFAFNQLFIKDRRWHGS